MAPTPQEFAPWDAKEYEAANPRERIVISGIAGLYPNAHNVKELSDLLYNKDNPIAKSSRWNNCKHAEVSNFTGHIPDLEYFDAQFFKVHYRLCNLMDPMSRKMLEQTYQALFDAGCHPSQLWGKNVGVFIGNCLSEAEKACIYTVRTKTGLGVAGSSRSMFANRISYYLNLKGPSVSIDESCCSSSVALQMAYDCIARGECEAAIVGGANLCLHPQTTLHYNRTIDMCMDGKTKSFDANANGCTKSEAINITFLQKAKDALRIYAYIVHAKCEYISLPTCETGARYGFYREPEDLTRFLRNFYKEAKVSPREVQYVEAFGAGSKESDKMELDVIDEIFCKDRKEALGVGSVMSNIGYVEAASGTSAIAKVLLGYHHGKLAANLHYKTPRNDIAAIRDGRIQILADHKEFPPTYAAVNGLSISGNFSHVLLHGFYKKKDTNKYKSSIPRIILCSGRQEDSVKKIIDDLKSRPIDPEEHALLHRFYKNGIAGHLGRGFVVLDTKQNNETVSLAGNCAYFDQGKRPLWFVYSGMGSQWVGMGKELMRIPVFAAAIERCHQVLSPKGIDIIDIITSDDKKIFDNILHSFVGIAAIQIGLTDVLKVMDIVPDNIIGHSVGEIGCAYADGCFTAEETILCAYSRGLVSVQTPFIRGSMAAVGLGYNEISKMCPPEIVVACHNSSESCTISGPAEIMSKFILSLTSQGIFAKEVPCSNIAYHSRYIAEAGPGLLKCMKEIIKTPRLRSPKWLSTSIPQDRWDEPLAKYSSAEYHTNNLLNPVLFEETSRQIPPDAMVIEIAPHGLLQAILKRSLPQSCTLIPLTRRGHPDNVIYLLEAIGKLYMQGLNPKIEELYPKVEFPVSNSTPMLSHLVEWAHQEEWSVPVPNSSDMVTAAMSENTISTYDLEHSYLKGHVIRGKKLYPFSAALVSVWDTLANSLNFKAKDVSVQFEHVYFHAQPILHKKNLLRLCVAIQKGTGAFEVLNENSLLMTGTITADITDETQPDNTDLNELNVSKEDIYKLLHAKDCHYLNDFRSIHCANESLTEAQIEWKNNWVTFLDGIIQLNVLRRKHNTVSKLNYIRKMVIDVKKQRTSIDVKDGNTFVNAKIIDLHDRTVCGGVIMKNMKFVDLPLLKDNIDLKSCEFINLFPAKASNQTKAMHMFVQIVADNIINKAKMNVVEIVYKTGTKSTLSNTEEIINSIPGINATYTKLNISQDKFKNALNDIDLIIINDLFRDDNTKQILKSVQPNTFVIHKVDSARKETSIYHVVSSHLVGNEWVELIICRPTNAKLSSALFIRSTVTQSSKDISGGEYYVPLEDLTDPELGVTQKIAQVGDLDSIYWVNEAPTHTDLNEEVKVHFAGINIAYVNKLLRSDYHVEGGLNKSVIDFSGLFKSTRVMGLIQCDSISSRVYANANLLLPVPDHWTLEDAATVPLAYSMAFYVLFVGARVHSKLSVCVQGGAGAFGQAIISVALAHGCEVFTTVSSLSKKQFLKKSFPQLKDDHIIENSHSLSSADTILSLTKGNGVDIFVSCAKDQFKNFFLKCVASYGVMIDIGLVQNREDYQFGLDNLSRNRIYYPVDLSTIFHPKFEDDHKFIRLLMIDGIRRGYVRPLTRVTYEAQDAPRAFRLQAAGNNRGRVLLDLRQLHLNLIPSIRCSSSSWQLIMSDDEIIALKLAERLIQRGAKKIILLLENASKCAQVQKSTWNKYDVEVKLLNATWKTHNLADVMKDCQENLLESIFIITTNEAAANVIGTVSKVAAFISKSTAPLKYFSLITTSNVKLDKGSWSGMSGHTKITKIQLPELSTTVNEQILTSSNVVSINNAIDALERALFSSRKTILAHKSNVPRETLLEQILKFTNISPEDMRKKSNLKLKDLNVDNVNMLAIHGYLRDVYDICLKIEDVLELSIQSIDQLEKRIMEYDFEESHGIGTYFPTMYTDDLLYTADIIYMQTLAFSTLYTIDIDMKDPHICIIPGVGGYHGHFTEMCERLKLPAITLQPGIDHPNESFVKLANRYIKILEKKAVIRDNFYLLGYESGVLVALEMAAIFEKRGLTGTVFCIGGSPAEIVGDFKWNLRDYSTTEELQMGVLKHAYSLITKEDPSVLDLCQNMEWSAKVDACIDTLRGKYTYSIQYIRKLINNMYTKLSSTLQSTPGIKKLQSEIISLRPQHSVSVSSPSLQCYSNKKVISYQLDSSLSSAHRDLMCSTIINKYLDPDTLDRFNKRNICHSYAIIDDILTL